MSDRPDRPSDDDLRESDPGVLAAVLADPELWIEPDPALEDAVVLAVADRAATRRPDDRRRSPARRRWVPMTAAAAILLVALAVAVAVVGTGSNGSGGPAPTGVEVALAGTERAPGAAATAVVTDTPLGTRIDLDVDGLAPAAAGTYYEAWMWNEDAVGVSAGTFHLRGGGGAIELWSGVALEDFPRLTVTLQEEGETTSSGEVVLAPPAPGS